MQPRDKKMVEEFDYSKLDSAFAKRSKPAKRSVGGTPPMSARVRGWAEVGHIR
jgi:hypothetical protein